ncbi:MAG: dephospho-CoA kinase [Muribaculaceae bacterium]
MATHITAITGGIGCGKSVVSRILSTMGYSVYDCDSRAKALMDESDEIKGRIASEISKDAVCDGVICRKVLSEIVFNDSEALKILNGIVHSAVRDDVSAWAHGIGGRVWVETAILYESGLHRFADDAWEVIAPVELRVERVMRRNGLSYDEVLSRVNSQGLLVPDEKIPTREIVNDGCMPLLPQINALLKIGK